MKKTALCLIGCLALGSLFADEMGSENIPNPVLAYSSGSNKHSEKKKSKSALAKYDGFFYGGTSVAYGRINPGSGNSLIDSGLLEPLLTIIQNVKSQQGGTSWRVFLGALVNISSVVSLGTELGFTQFPETKGEVKPDLAGFGGLFSNNNGQSAQISGSISARGYGIDLLYNATFFLIPELYMAFKPGIQFAYQKNMVRLNVSVPKSSSGGGGSSSGLDVRLKNKFANTGLLPQVILATGWVFKNNQWGKWDFSEYPLTVEFYYQHVFGSDDAPATSRVSSRDAIGGTVGLQF